MTQALPKLPAGLPTPDWSDDAYGVALYCGDCLEIMPTLPRMDALVTDPPYGMSFVSNHRQRKYSAIVNDGDAGCLVWAAGYAATHSAYVWCRWNNLAHIPEPKSLITWVKNNWSMGDLEHEHARQTEVCAFYPGPSHDFPSGRPSDVVRHSRTGNDNHPTEKPVSLMEEVIGWTRGVVFDPFAGSGTTGVSCVNLGRSFVGIEKEPKYFDIAVKRISDAIIDHQAGPLFATHQPGQPGLFEGDP